MIASGIVNPMKFQLSRAFNATIAPGAKCLSAPSISAAWVPPAAKRPATATAPPTSATVGQKSPSRPAPLRYSLSATANIAKKTIEIATTTMAAISLP